MFFELSCILYIYDMRMCIAHYIEIKNYYSREIIIKLFHLWNITHRLYALILHFILNHIYAPHNVLMNQQNGPKAANALSRQLGGALYQRSLR